MKHRQLVTNRFGSTAEAYLTSTTHSSGADLAALAAEAANHPGGRILDLGCGAGHASFAVAPHAKEVVAYDPTKEMLSIVAAAAKQKKLANIGTVEGRAEELPFEAEEFDLVVSRLSAHHWHDVGSALAEIQRVLKPEGRVLLIDVAGADHPLLDTHLQAVEILRDPSHVRDYTAAEWLSFFRSAGMKPLLKERWRLPIDFSSWIERMQTPESRTMAIRSLRDSAPDEVRNYFRVQDDGSFEHDVLMVESRK